MGFMLIFALILVGINRLEYEENVHFSSSLSILPPPMDWACQTSNTTFIDLITFVPVQNNVFVSDWMATNKSVPEFNSSVIITDHLLTDASEPEFNTSFTIMDQIPHFGSVPEVNSNVMITDQLPGYNSSTKPVALIKDQYMNIDFSVPVLKFKAAAKAFKNGFKSGSEGIKLLNFAGLLSFIRLAQVAVAILMVLLLWKQRQESLCLHQEISSAEKDTVTDLSRLGDMRNTLYSEHIQFTKADNDLPMWDKKLDGVSSKLHDENSNLEEMYKCFMEWKHDWNEQSHKIKLIDTYQFNQIADLPNANVDKLIKEQEQDLRDYFLHAEEQFNHINQNFVHGHDSITEISADLGTIYDAMNEQSANRY